MMLVTQSQTKPWAEVSIAAVPSAGSLVSHNTNCPIIVAFTLQFPVLRPPLPGATAPFHYSSKCTNITILCMTSSITSLCAWAWTWTSRTCQQYDSNRQLAALMCVLTGAVIGLIMRFIVMNNSNRPSARMQTTGSPDGKLCSHLEWPKSKSAFSDIFNLQLMHLIKIWNAK